MPETMKIRLVVRVASMPASEAPRRFCATAWICRPQTERLMKSASAIIKAIAMTAAIAFWPVSITGPSAKRPTSINGGPRNEYGPTILSTKLINSSERPKVTTTAYSSFMKPQLA